MNDELLASAIRKSNNIYLTVRGKKFKINLDRLLELERKVEKYNISQWKQVYPTLPRTCSLPVIAKTYEYQNEFLNRFDLNNKQNGFYSNYLLKF